MSFVDPLTLNLVSTALDAAALRHAVIAQNIANANVSGAPVFRVEFEELLQPLQSALAEGVKPDMQQIAQPEVVRLDGSATIALDDQMAALSSNAIHYQTLMKALKQHLGLVSTAINDGRR